MKIVVINIINKNAGHYYVVGQQNEKKIFEN